MLRELRIEGEVEAFAELVDGHPLLLKLVADLIKNEYPQDPSLERLQDLGLGNLQELLTDPRVVGQHRRENVGMVLVLDASFERLADWQKIWLQNVSVYRGAFDGEAAVAMLPQADESRPLPVETAELEQELRKLVKRSLLEEKLNGKRQFAFQPVVLEYVRYKAGEQTEAHQQAIAYYRSIAKEKPWQSSDNVKEYLEIFYHYYQLRDYGSAFDTVRTCDDFLTLRGYYAVRVDLYGQLVAAWQQTDARENGSYRDSLNSLGIAYFSLGQYQTAIDYHQQQLEIARSIGDRYGEANSLGNLGNAYDYLGQYRKAIDYLQQSQEIFRDIGDHQWEGGCLGNLGNIYNSLGQYQTAIDYHQQQLEIAREIGDRRVEAYSLHNLGNAYNSLGQYQRAIEFYQQSLEIKREIGDRRGEANSLIGLGNAYDSLGQYQRAIEFYQQSLEIFRDIGDRNGEAKAWFNLGLALENVNRESDAVGAYRNARELYQAMGLDPNVQDCDKAIDRLSQPQVPIWRWLKRLWQ